MTALSSFKDQGNEEFKAGNFLKAAALYSKALKEDPASAVLFSNRSAALLKLNKVSKALSDADECIKLRPEWEKGHFRKASALEAMDKLAEALEAYQRAQAINPDNSEVASKIRLLAKFIRKQPPPAAQKKGGVDAPKGGDAPKESTKEARGPAKQFAEELLDYARAEVAEHGTAFAAMVSFLPGKAAPPHEEQELHVRGEHAFDSPETLGSFVGFLRETSQKLLASAAGVVVPKASVAYPQTWKGAQWPYGDADGVLVQVEGPKLRKMWFLPIVDGKQTGAPKVVDYKFALLPTLLR